MNGIHALIKETAERSLTSLAHGRQASMNKKAGSHQVPNLLDFILDFPASSTEK